jgi:hypothetical protein
MQQPTNNSQTQLLELPHECLVAVLSRAEVEEEVHSESSLLVPFQASRT